MKTEVNRTTENIGLHNYNKSDNDDGLGYSYKCDGIGVSQIENIKNLKHINVQHLLICLQFYNLPR